MIRIQATDQVTGEREHLAEGKAHLLAAFLCSRAISNYGHAITFLDQPIKLYARTAFKCLVLDLCIKRLLALKSFVAMQNPNDVVSEARQNLGVISPTKSPDVSFDNGFACGHTVDRSNENKLSDGRQGRARLQVKLF
jgi:hypothetical protein